jgi:hypothetical protein
MRLGNLVDNLPTFVVLPDSRGLPYNQRGNFSSGFLPVKYQGLVLNAAAPEPIPNLRPASQFGFAQGNADQKGLELLQHWNETHAPNIRMTRSFGRVSQLTN